MSQDFYSNGKLLITGEYAVLDGATALAIPTKFGQTLSVSKTDGAQLFWNSFNADGKPWFRASFALPGLQLLDTDDANIAKTLKAILAYTQKSNPDFLSTDEGFIVKTKLSFDRHWGLGTSSTLIANVAAWGMVDPFQLLANTFGGSGYDVACAQAKTPLLFSLKNGKAMVAPTTFNPSFSDRLFFVYLNQKKDSREAISTYRRQSVNKKQLTKRISELTRAILDATALNTFEMLLLEHEQLLSQVLQLSRIQDGLFRDFNGVVKSLGGWGGDFVLATGDEKTPDYFKAKGFQTVIPFQDMAL